MRIAKKFGNLQKSDYLATVESPPKGFEELKTTDFRMPDGERHIEFNYYKRIAYRKILLFIIAK